MSLFLSAPAETWAAAGSASTEALGLRGRPGRRLGFAAGASSAGPAGSTAAAGSTEGSSFAAASGLAFSAKTDAEESGASAVSGATSLFAFLARETVRLGLVVPAAASSEASETLSPESAAAAREELAALRLGFFAAGVSGASAAPASGASAAGFFAATLRTRFFGAGFCSSPESTESVFSSVM